MSYLDDNDDRGDGYSAHAEEDSDFNSEFHDAVPLSSDELSHFTSSSFDGNETNDAIPDPDFITGLPLFDESGSRRIPPALYDGGDDEDDQVTDGCILDSDYTTNNVAAVSIPIHSRDDYDEDEDDDDDDEVDDRVYARALPVLSSEFQEVEEGLENLALRPSTGLHGQPLFDYNEDEEEYEEEAPVGGGRDDGFDED